ncbi:MAG: hypothetical protein EOP87_22205 [Verrucomicrobiaceae bacterium]|nr:MAG: hypothetical protein EOP87_22205 [Verrucomicrobiaceae bacterium]
MKSKSIRGGILVRFLPITLLIAPAQASVIYLTTTTGAIYQYDSVTDMAAQTNTTTSGTLVTTIAAYGTDQGTSMDLSSGIIYRINAAGDVVSYSGLAGYLADSGGITVATAVYGGNDALNGFSYDSATGGFYAIGGGAAGNSAQGDLIQWASLADFLTNANRTVTVATFNGNLFNFHDPEATTGTTFGAVGFPATSRNTRYYQSSAAGRLEGWESLAQYVAAAASQGDKRVHYTADNVLAGTSTAFGSNTIDAATAFVIPEPASASLAAASGLLLFRRRRKGA